MRVGMLFVVALLGAACGTRGGDGGSRIVDRDGGLGCLGTTHGPLGPCRCSSDCASPAICVTEESTGFPSGVCSIPCEMGCPAGSGCQGSFCSGTCTTSADCGAGRICWEGLCFPFCQADSDCYSGNCNRYSGYCLAPGLTPDGAAVSQPCLRDEDCLSDLCSDSSGLCIGPCAISTQSCPDENEICVSNEAPANDFGVCLVRCAADGSCAVGSCRVAPVPAGAEVCQP